MTQIDLSNTKHGSILFEKQKNVKEKYLQQAYKHYLYFRRSIDGLEITNDEAIFKLTQAANNYRDNVLYLFESRPNSGQEAFRYTILEEFFYHLFKDLVKKKFNQEPSSIVMGKANSYVSLSFSPESFLGLYENPIPYIHTKDQDFVLGCAVDLKISPKNELNKENETEIVVPVIAIECKTYIERNMLDSCAATASRLKAAMPYCLYIVASEYMKMDQAYPELTDIDEVFILCKASVGERTALKKKGLPPHKLDENLMVELFHMVERHLNRVWWSPNEALSRGRVIGRP
uniref:Bpu10I restriction endonuclease beta subunit n=1 Tax=Bacillus pumilus TaxID=1408 RepID=O52852_BACPU|nr:Bpu10I restriction endonuclease beta subunit [Bacillus pumilus]